jgi:SAM-dependent methyltransferase
MSQSLLYRFPQIYIAGLKLYHGQNFDTRYHYMASFVKPENSVLEPGCGPAILADYLPKNTHYTGFDTNLRFLDYAKNKKRSVFYGNVLDKKNYKPTDIIVACDILHHLDPKTRKIFIELCWKNCKHIFIVCDPAKSRIPKNGFWQRLGEWSEQDGTNNFKNEYFLTIPELLGKIKNGFEVIKPNIKRTFKKFGEDIIVVYYKNA